MKLDPGVKKNRHEVHYSPEKKNIYQNMIRPKKDTKL
jgi:hypothetical protein